MVVIAKCIKGNENFKTGEYYPVLGNNNGVHIAYVDKNGDPKETMFHNYGNELCEISMEDGVVEDGAVFVSQERFIEVGIVDYRFETCVSVSVPKTPIE